MPPPIPPKKPLQMPAMPNMAGPPLDLHSLVMGGPQMAAGAGLSPRPMPPGAPAQMPPMNKEAIAQAIMALLAGSRKPDVKVAESKKPPPQEPPSAYRGK